MPKGIMHYAVVKFPSHVIFFIRALPIKKKKIYLRLTLLLLS